MGHIMLSLASMCTLMHVYLIEMNVTIGCRLRQAHSGLTEFPCGHEILPLHTPLGSWGRKSLIWFRGINASKLSIRMLVIWSPFISLNKKLYFHLSVIQKECQDSERPVNNWLRGGDRWLQYQSFQLGQMVSSNYFLVIDLSSPFIGTSKV